MIDSDNRNALDNYGVWVKKSPKDFSKDENDSIFNSNSSDDSQDSFEIAADLPDFSGLDNISSEDNAKDDAFDSGETSLTSEELLNITGSIAESSKNYEDITNFSATEEATDSISELSDSQISETASLADSDSEKIDLAFEDAEKAELLNENENPDFTEDFSQISPVEKFENIENDIAKDLEQDLTYEELPDTTGSEMTFDELPETGTSEELLSSCEIPDTFEEETALFADEEPAISEKTEQVSSTPKENDILAQSNAILLQIQKELSSLQKEISSLKDDFSKFKSGKSSSEQQEETSGFFSDVDEDEKISLSGEELNNILISADSTTDEDKKSEESTDDISNAPVMEEPAIETPASEDSSMSISSDSFDSFNSFENEKTEEPVFEDAVLEESDNAEDLPDELSVPKVSDILPETDSFAENFDTENETFQPVEEISFDEPAVDENSVEDIADSIDDILVDASDQEDLLPAQDSALDSAISEPVDELANSVTSDDADDVLTADKELENISVAEPSISDELFTAENALDAEPVVDEPIIDEPVIDEPIIEEPVVFSDSADEPVLEEAIDAQADTLEKTEETEEMSGLFEVEEDSGISLPETDSFAENFETENETFQPVEEISFDEPAVDENSVEDIADSIDDILVDASDQEDLLPAQDSALDSAISEPVDELANSVTSDDADDVLTADKELENISVAEPSISDELFTAENALDAEPVVDEPIIDEPVIDEPIIEEPVVFSDSADEPVLEEAIDAQADTLEKTENAPSNQELTLEDESAPSGDSPFNDEIPEEPDSIFEDISSAVTADNEEEPIRTEIPSQTLDELYPQDPPIKDTLTLDNLNYLEKDENLNDFMNSEEDESAVILPESEITIPAENEKSAESLPKDLTNDIKAVLSYMDQLLENLPDEKISEFAQSEQFILYKKLFTELGLA